MLSRGVFISVEGGEGVGKSTQVELLAEHLRRRGLTVTATKEPGGSSIGSRVRELLLHTDVEMAPWTEAYLFAAERAQHVRDVIAPALRAGHVVLCDRYSASSVVYQGIVRGLGAAQISHLSWQGTGGLVPTLTVVLDDDHEHAHRRATRDGADRIEQEAATFHQQVREAFSALASGAVEVSPRLWDRAVLVDAAGPIEVVHQRVVEAVDTYLPKVRRGWKVCSR